MLHISPQTAGRRQLPQEAALLFGKKENFYERVYFYYIPSKIKNIFRPLRNGLIFQPAPEYPEKFAPGNTPDIINSEITEKPLISECLLPQKMSQKKHFKFYFFITACYDNSANKYKMACFVLILTSKGFANAAQIVPQ